MADRRAPGLGYYQTCRRSWEAAWRQLDPQDLWHVGRSLVFCLAAPFLVAFSFEVFGWLLLAACYGILLLALPVYVLCRSVYAWSQSEDALWLSLLRELRLGPPGNPLGTALPRRGVPVVTLSLIAANVAIHYLSPDPWVYAIANDAPEAWPWTSISSIFAHGDEGHLWGNMFFLWIFGSTLEGRIASGRFFLSYLALGIVAGLASALALIAAGYVHDLSLGASGAIAGLMGLFMVRCYFSRLDLGVPILGMLGAGLPVALRLRVPALALLTLFFLKDVLGARDQLEGLSAGVGYWAHVGGLVAGVLLGTATGLLREGLKEALELRAYSSQPHARIAAAEEAREKLLELDPAHTEALLERARRRSRYELRPEARDDYLRAVRLLLPERRREAAEIFAEAFRKYRATLTPQEQLRLTPTLEALGELEVAARALELSSARDDLSSAERQKMLLYEARLLVAMDLPHAALQLYEGFLREFPASPSRPIVAERLAKLRQQEPEAAGS